MVRALALCGISGWMLSAAGAGVSVVQKTGGYNSWPMIQAIGKRLVCAYSRGSGHTIAEGVRGVWAKTSDDGGRTWSEEHSVVNDPEVGEVTIGKGFDADGAMLLWVRRWGRSKGHDLYRTRDGIRFEKISTFDAEPVPMQVTDIIRVPGVGFLAPWFSVGYEDVKGAERSWGFLKSADGGRSWERITVERGLKVEDWPTEPSAAYLGNGRILVIGRSEGDTRYQFQITSADFGKTWKKERTNITDVASSTPSLVYDAQTGIVSNYYYQRGARKLKCRRVSADRIFDHPAEWPSPTVLFEGHEERLYDAGNANATELGGCHYVATYTGSATDAEVVVVCVPGPIARK